jgi:hypothetical protein
MASVRILSVNCQGLGSITKRKKTTTKNVMNSSTKRKKTKERDNKNNDCNQTWLNNITYCNFYSYKLYPFNFI